MTLPEGWVEVSAYQGGTQSAQIGAGEMATIVLELSDVEALEGRVETRDGVGVDGAEVRMSATRDPRWSRVIGKSERDGRFTIQAPRGLIRYVSAEKAGVGIAPFVRWSGSAEAEPIVLILDPCGGLEFRVNDASGAGVAGVLITIGDGRSVSSHSERQGGVRLRFFQRFGRTRPDGTVEFADVPLGRMPWSMTGEGWATMNGTVAIGEGRVSELTIVARATPVLRGVVWCQSAEAESAPVVLTFKQGSSEAVRHVDVNVPFKLDGLPAGPVEGEALVRISGSVWRATTSLTLSEGQVTEWFPVLARVRNWSGFVCDGLGRGLEGWRVSVRDANGRLADAITDEAGRWSIDRSYDTLLEVGAFAPVGHGEFERLPRVAFSHEFSQSTPEVRSVIGRADVSCGSLAWTFDEGADLVMWIETETSWMGSNMIAGNESDGRYVVDMLPPQRYRCVARSGKRRVIKDVEVVGGERVDLGRIYQKTDGSVTCRIGDFKNAER